MRTHLQGVFLLCMIVLALWGLTSLAAPSLRDAFGDDGALVADSGDDLIELTVDGETLDAPLTQDELMRLQFQLARGGFLDARTDVDGIWGDVTRAAIVRAGEAWGLTDPTDREVLEYADALFNDIPLFGAP